MSACFFLALCASAADRQNGGPPPTKMNLKKKNLSSWNWVKKGKSTNFTFRASLIDPPKKRISWEKQVVCEIISTTRFPEGGKMKSKWLEGIQMKKKNLPDLWIVISNNNSSKWKNKLENPWKRKKRVSSGGMVKKKSNSTGPFTSCMWLGE